MALAKCHSVLSNITWSRAIPMSFITNAINVITSIRRGSARPHIMVAIEQWRYFWVLLFITSSECIHSTPWSPQHKTNPTSTTQSCGVSPDGSSGSRIVGGESVTSLRYPWFAALVLKSAFISYQDLSDLKDLSVQCAGTLITNRHVLSAAHCFNSNKARPQDLYWVVFKLLNRCNLQDRANLQYVAMSKVNVHPDYSPATLGGDIAVITLATPVFKLTPACLPPRGSNTIGDSIIIGFGSTREKQQSTYPCTLQQAEVKILSAQQCQSTDLNSEFADIPGTFCAGRLAGGVDTCDGDSGGPLQTVSNGRYTVDGIVSFGEGCARPNLPGVYTRVAYYRGWIDNIIRHSDTNHGNRPGLLNTVGQILGNLFPKKDFGR